MKLYHYFCPVGWGCRIHRLLLCRGVRLPPTSVLDMTLNNLKTKQTKPNYIIICIRDPLNHVTVCNLCLLYRNTLHHTTCPVGSDYWIHRVHLWRGLRHPLWASWYDTKQSDGEVPVMLGLWRMQSTSSLLLLPGSLWPGMVAPDRALSMG